MSGNEMLSRGGATRGAAERCRPLIIAAWGGGGLVTRGMLTEGLNSVGREVSVSGAEPRVIRQT